MTDSKKHIGFSLLMLIASASFSQTFEGKVVYNNSFKSKMPNVTDAQFADMMGNQQVYFLKGGNYKSTMNGTMMEWQLYRKADNKMYMKMSTSPAVLWNDASVNVDEIQKAEINKGVMTILGHKCDELILTCKSGVQKYYFSPKLKVDPALFSQHKFGNMDAVMSRTKALPLKIIIDNPQFVLESTAVEIAPGKLNDKEFELPEGSKLQKSPY